MFYFDDDVDGWYGWYMVFNATFNNISVISWLVGAVVVVIVW
jgi:hypothetical protein